MFLLIIILLLIALGLIVAGLIILKRPYWGLVLMVSLIPLDSLTKFGFGRTIIVFIGVATFGMWFIRLLLRKETIHLNVYPSLFLVLLLIWSILSYTWAYDQEMTLFRIQSLVQALLFFFLFQNLVRDKKSLNILIIAFFFSALIASALAIERGMSSSNLLRASAGEDQSPAHLAESLGIGILMIPYLINILKNNYLRLLVLSGGFIIATAIFMTSTRGAMVGIVAAFIITWFIAFSKLIRFRTIIFVTSLLIVGFIYMASTGIISKYAYLRVITILNSSKTQGGSGRTNIWAVGMEMVKDNPVVGVGLQNFPIRFRNYIDITDFPDKGPVKRFRDPHNIFLSVQSELGIIGTLIFLSFLFLNIRELINRRNQPIAILGLLLIFFILISGMVLTLLYRKYFWFIMGIAAVIPMLYEGDKKLKS